MYIYIYTCIHTKSILFIKESKRSEAAILLADTWHDTCIHVMTHAYMS